MAMLEKHILSRKCPSRIVEKHPQAWKRQADLHYREFACSRVAAEPAGSAGENCRNSRHFSTASPALRDGGRMHNSGLRSRPVGKIENTAAPESQAPAGFLLKALGLQSEDSRGLSRVPVFCLDLSLCAWG